MKICIMLSLILLAYTSSLSAQSDSVGKKYYAYAHFYANDIDQNTEYISSVFCWVFAPTKNAKGYPGDYLTKWAISNFKEQLPHEKIKDCTCRFQIDSTGKFYSAAEAVRISTLESKECSVQSIDVVIVNFPACIDK